MRYAVFGVIFTVFLVCFSSMIGSLVVADPADEAVTFLKAARSGSYAETVRNFGGNRCHCSAKGGWASYLVYGMAQEPNMTFLFGHPFEIGKPQAKRLKTDRPTLVPWEHPEDSSVDVPLTFSADKFQPLFLPLPMAYGMKMSEAELDEFLKDPDKDAWRGFTLRMRPSLAPGILATAEEAKKYLVVPKDGAEKKKAEDQDRSVAKDQANEQKQNSGQLGELERITGLDSKALAGLNAKTEDPSQIYVMPKDPGPVFDAQGNQISTSEIAKRLPRLKSATMRLHIVRRGQLKDWTVYHFGFVDQVLTMPSGQDVALKHFLPPES